MKIVINKCFGGFGLSRACFLELFKHGAKIIERTPFTKATSCLRKPRGDICPSEDYTPADEPGWYKWKGFGISDSGVYAPDGADPIHCSTSSHKDEHRTDPDLIALIEEHGSKWASGGCAELVIVEVPDNIEWIIEEYDGNEHVAEKHTTWQGKGRP